MSAGGSGFSADGSGAGDAPRREGRCGRPSRNRPVVGAEMVPLEALAGVMGIEAGRLAALCVALAPGARPVFLRGAMLGPNGWTVPARWLAGVAALPGWPFVSVRAAAELLGIDRATAERLPMVDLVPGFRRVALGLVLSGKAKREEAA